LYLGLPGVLLAFFLGFMYDLYDDDSTTPCTQLATTT
jgi:hypothetical protein